MPHAATSNAFESVSCLLCGNGTNKPLTSHQNDPFLTKGGVTDAKVSWVICEKCGFCYQNPRPTRALFDNIYQNTYRPKEPSEKYLRIIGKDTKERAEWIAARAPKGSTALDIGCAAGLLVKELIANGLQAAGIEPNGNFSGWGREKLGLPLRTGYFPEENEPKYDLLILSHVLEHLHSPAELLEKIRRHLSPGGHLFIEVPDLARPKYAFYDAYVASQHLYLFSHDSITRFLSQNGFAVTAIEDVPRGLRVLARPTEGPAKQAIEGGNTLPMPYSRLRKKFFIHRLKVAANDFGQKVIGRRLLKDQ